MKFNMHLKYYGEKRSAKNTSDPKSYIQKSSPMVIKEALF